MIPGISKKVIFLSFLFINFLQLSKSAEFARINKNNNIQNNYSIPKKKFNEEPLPPEHPFWFHDKVTVTPHISAPTRLRSSIKSILVNIDKIKTGLQPLGLVEKERFY